MPERSPKCGKCGGTMEEGYLLDHGHMNMKTVEQWVAGPPKQSFWMGVDTSGRKVKRVATWHCTKCGFLESYAS